MYYAAPYGEQVAHIHLCGIIKYADELDGLTNIDFVHQAGINECPTIPKLPRGADGRNTCA